MDFDHVDGEKVDDVAGLRIDTGKWERIAAAITRCELVCANCHRIRTHIGRRGKDSTAISDQTWFKELYFSVVVQPQRVVSSRLTAATDKSQPT